MQAASDVARRETSEPPALRERFLVTRAHTEHLCEPLEPEDFVVSSMPDASPTKWHLAHTSWFFETFLLGPHAPAYRSPDARYAFLFNSYYVQAGERHCRAQRGLATRPTVRQVFEYRRHVDEAVVALCDRLDGDPTHPAGAIIELGIQHEQQHQELLLTDIKHLFWMNPMRPAYRCLPDAERTVQPLQWQDVAGGVKQIGHNGDGFAFDNELPQHREFLEPCRVATRLVTNSEFLQFIDEGGYRRPELWLSAGWAAVQAGNWQAPLYWEAADGGGWREFTLAGDGGVNPGAPVCHVSYYEADAFARWAGARLPTEAEWETVARDYGAAQLYSDCWQWTQSAYTAYPGYVPATGAIGEYNGKWMSDQWVLRGGSCATPASHARVSYRNFFPSTARWQFSGIRLAASA